MFVISGKTFPIKDRIRSMGGRWNGTNQTWEFYDLSDYQREWFKQQVGIIVTEQSGKPRVEQPARHTPMTLVERQHEATEAIERARKLDELISDILDAETTASNGKSIIHGDDQTHFNAFQFPNPTAFFGFSSLRAATNYVEKIPVSISEKASVNHGWKIDGERNEFAATKNMAEALTIARKGWPKGREYAEEIREMIVGEHATQRKTAYNVVGGSVSIGRYLAGNPVNMRHRKKREGRQIKTFFVEAGMSAMIEAEHAIMRAAIVAAIVDVLEANDYQCEIVSVDMTKHNGYSECQIATTLKSAGEPLSLDDVVFGMGHPSLLRRINFAIMASEPALWECCREAFGVPCDAFGKSKSTGPNEFYIKQFSALVAKHMKGKPQIEQVRIMWDCIRDPKLPMELISNG